MNEAIKASLDILPPSVRSAVADQVHTGRLVVDNAQALEMRKAAAPSGSAYAAEGIFNHAPEIDVDGGKATLAGLWAGLPVYVPQAAPR